MEIFDSMRKVMMAGLGVQEKLKEVVDELVEKGQLSDSQGATLVKEWAEKAEKSSAEIQKAVTEAVTKAMEMVSPPSKADVEELKKQVQALSERLDKLERGKESMD